MDDSTYSTGIGGDYIVVISNVTAPNSCADTSAPVAVMQNLNPVIDLVPSSTSLCSGETVNLDANASPALTYSWTPGGETDPDINITTGGDYGVTVTNAAGCDTSANVTITEFKISDDIRERLLNGYDDIELTLKKKKLIELYENKNFYKESWRTIDNERKS